MTVAALATAVLASPASATPPLEVFEETAAWMCPGDGFVPNHCINAKSLEKANTFNIKVFAPGDLRGPQESATTDPRADLRPCRHDEGSTDDTWWVFTDDFGGETLYVCHHSGQQQFLAP